jgi:hypothetical protein
LKISGDIFSKSTPLTFLLQHGFTLEVLDASLNKKSIDIAPVTLPEADVDDVREKIKVIYNLKSEKIQGYLYIKLDVFFMVKTLRGNMPFE